MTPKIATAQQAIDAAASHGMADLRAAIGVSRGASSEEVRKRAKELFRLVHPDKCNLPGAAEAFDVVRTAERVLTDEMEWRKYQAEMARRREMDRELREQMSRDTANRKSGIAARQRKAERDAKRKTGRKERQNQNKRGRESGA